MKKWLSRSLIVMLLVSLTGCWDMRELEHMFYVHALGVDYKNNRYEVYAQVLNFSTLAKQESGGSSGGQGEQVGAWVGKGVGSTLISAIHNLYATAQRRIYWGHLSAIVFSKEALNKGLKETLDSLTRYNEVRHIVWLYGTDKPIEEILNTTPVMESTPVYSKLGDPKEVFEQSSFIEPIRINRFMSQVYEPNRTAFLPNLTISQEQWTDPKESHTSLSINGVWLIQNWQLKGNMFAEELPGIIWFSEDANRILLTIPFKGKPAITMTMKQPNSKIIPIIQDGKVAFQINISVEGSITSKEIPMDEKLIERRAAEAIETEIRQTFEKALQKNHDVYNLFNTLYRKDFRRWNQMAKSHSLTLHPDLLKKVQVKVKVFDYGKAISNPDEIIKSDSKKKEKIPINQ
ncbi:Ger(x)C family spore germination protein [Hazenella coriacea]|uniref:Ger(X)C family germination protein n=1 Tax=Hazenella coriacea TaxID=1179467 RepID=A0A4R3L9B3_9BACL|nr:Ger(x)C family spore germination protein [Hazenella coriacea]TCS96651.1 Ger(x)C family germination protein [Hazenella coriacea]